MSKAAASSAEKTAWGGVAFGLAIASFAAFQQFKMPPVLPVMLQQYDYDLVLAGGFMSVYALVGLLASLPLARLIAKRGPLEPLWCALAVFLLGNLLTLALPQSGWVVLAGRALEGLAFAVLALVGPASANANAARHHLPLVFGLTAAWIPMGQFSAALVALPTQDAGLWRPVWWVGIAGILVLALWLLQRRGRGLYLGGGAATHAPLKSEERLLLWVAGMTFLLFSGQYLAYMTWFPTYLVDGLGFTPAEAIYAYLIPVVLVGAFNVISASFLKRGLTPANLLVIGFGLNSLCWWALPYVGEGLLGLALLLVYGAGAGLVPAGLFAMPNTILGSGGATIAAFGIIMTMRNVGVLIGPILLALLITADGGWHVAAPVFAALCTAALLLALWLGRRLSLRAPADSRQAR
ncbi:MAG: hypothetical protein Kilf2KO_30750 [Rhodospirillales bacterium]